MADDAVLLTEDEQAELHLRRAVLASEQQLAVNHRQIAVLLESELKLFTRHLLTAKGLDPDKEYSIQEGGVLVEVAADDG